MCTVDLHVQCKGLLNLRHLNLNLITRIRGHMHLKRVREHCTKIFPKFPWMVHTVHVSQENHMNKINEMFSMNHYCCFITC